MQPRVFSVPKMFTSARILWTLPKISSQFRDIYIDSSVAKTILIMNRHRVQFIDVRVNVKKQ